MSQSSAKGASLQLPPELQGELDHRITAGLVEVPAMPDTSRKIMAIRFDDESFDPAELTRVIESDPALSAQILRIANSVYYAPRAPIVSLQQATSRLGAKRVREVVLMATLKNETFVAPGLRDSMQRSFRCAVAAGFFAQEAARLKRLSVEETFLLGLLHNIGEVALMREVSSLARQKGVQISEASIAEYAAHRGAVVGAEICLAWKLSPRLSEAIHHQHNPRQAPDHIDAAAFSALGRQCASAWLTNPRPALRDALAGQETLDILELYPDDLAALDESGEALSELLETV